MISNDHFENFIPFYNEECLSSLSICDDDLTNKSSMNLNMHIWKNNLYIKRIKQNPELQKLHKNMFPDLSIEQMVFVYYNYFTKKSTNYDSTNAFELWDAPENIKKIVNLRINQNILSDH